MKDYLQVWKVNDKITSYRFPIIKIICCLVFGVLSFFRFDIFPGLAPVGEYKVLDKLLYLFLWALVLVIYVSIAEMITLHDRKSEAKTKKTKIRPDAKGIELPLDKIYALLKENDIMDFVAQAGSASVRFGASSDYAGNQYFHKRYYLDSQEFTDLAPFSLELDKLRGENGLIKIIRVDDVPAHKYFK